MHYAHSSLRGYKTAKSWVLIEKSCLDVSILFSDQRQKSRINFFFTAFFMMPLLKGKKPYINYQYPVTSKHHHKKLPNFQAHWDKTLKKSWKKFIVFATLFRKWQSKDMFNSCCNILRIIFFAHFFRVISAQCEVPCCLIESQA